MKTDAICYLSAALRIQFIKLSFHPLNSFSESVLQPCLYGDRCVTLLFRLRACPTRSCAKEEDVTGSYTRPFKLSNFRSLINLTVWWAHIDPGKSYTWRSSLMKQDHSTLYRWTFAQIQLSIKQTKAASVSEASAKLVPLFLRLSIQCIYTCFN